MAPNLALGRQRPLADSLPLRVSLGWRRFAAVAGLGGVAPIRRAIR